MSPTQGAVYALVRWLIDHLLGSEIGRFGMAFLTIVVILRFLAWLKAVAKRETMDAAEREDSTRSVESAPSALDGPEGEIAQWNQRRQRERQGEIAQWNQRRQQPGRSRPKAAQRRIK